MYNPNAPDSLDQELRTSNSVKLHSVFVVLPAHNEEVGLERLLERIRYNLEPLCQEYTVIVVDDASTDATSEVAQAASIDMPIHLIRHEQNQGLSGAIKTGLNAATRLAEDDDIIISLDADDTHSPGSMERMLMMVREGHDVVIASRYQPGSQTLGVPSHRLAMTFFARWLFKIITPIPGVRDYTCGYRAYRTDALKRAMTYHGDSFFTEKGFSCMADILLKMRNQGFVFGEVPMILRYDRKPGDSKMNVFRTVRLTLVLLLKRRFGINH